MLQINSRKKSSFLRFLIWPAIAVLVGLSSHSAAQGNYKSEAEMIKAADAMFEGKNFSGAMPLYSQLVSLYPKDLNYNMKYGHCLFHADKDKAACLKFLKFAVSKEEAVPISHYYYALALHGNYDFDRAIKQYTKFKELSGNKTPPDLQVDRQIEMCNNGKALLNQVFDLNVIDKKEMGYSEFFRVYELGEIGGKIIVKPDNFKSKADLKSNELSLIHLPSEARVVYFSGYGDIKANGKDIFRSRKSGADWGPPENIGSVVNTNYDEDFPFMHPDGTLYFASKGHNSMGGYDLFKSEYNESAGTWSKPENLNFAISSAFDDLLFITDMGKQLAYFASGRSVSDGKLNVYRVQIARKPIDKAFLAGKFVAEGDVKVEAAKITIYDTETNTKVGTYFTDKESGEYSISLPKGGKTYKFVVETDENSPVHTGKVEVPAQDELVSLKQEIRLVGSGDQQKLVIKNLFNEKEEVSPDMKAELLRQSSDLAVNTTEEQVKQEIAASPPEAGKAAAATDLSIGARHTNLVKDLESLSARMSSDVNLLNQQIAFGFRYSFDKAKVADKKYDDVEVLRQKMLNENDQAAKESSYNQLIAIRKELDPIASDAIVSFDFSRSLANEYEEKINDASKVKEVLGAIKSRGTSSTDEQKKSDLDQHAPLVTDLKSMQSAFEIAPQHYNDLLASSGEKLTKAEARYNNARKDNESLQLEITDLEKRIQNATNKKTKEQLQSELDVKKIDMQDLQFEFGNINRNYRKLKSEVSALQADAAQINSFIAKVKSNKTPVTQLSATDQAELNKIIDFLKEQRLIDDVIGTEMEAVSATKQKEQNLEQAQLYAPTDLQGKPIDYDDLYKVNLSVIELITDNVRRNSETSSLYKNWAETVKEEREIRENELTYTKEKSAQQVLAERIKILQEKEKLYAQKNLEFSEKSKQEASIASGNVEEKSGTGSGPSSGKALASSSQTTSLLTSAAVVGSGKGKLSKKEIDKSFSEAMAKATEGKPKNALAATQAAYEVQWASAINKVIIEKEKELSAITDPAKLSALEQEIRELKAEKERHEVAASAEFSEVEISMTTGEIKEEGAEKYFIPFDPAKGSKQDYETKYNELLSAVENHQILTPDQKNKELALIHSFWSRTIQDDILWQEEERTKLKSAAEIQQINNKISDLSAGKKQHIELSNQYFEKYRKSQEFLAVKDVPQEVERPQVVERPATEEVTSTENYQDYAAEHSASKAAKEEELAKIESGIKSAGSKSEKQKLSLSAALLERQVADETKAEADLQKAGSAPLLTNEVSVILSNEGGSWKEKSEDYVFKKLNFDAIDASNSASSASYAEAQKNYSEVQLLESRKEGILESNVVDKNAEAELLSVQASIEAAKMKTYEALAEAGKAEFESNNRQIETLLAANPNIQTTNPRLWRNIKAAEVIFNEAGEYRKKGSAYTSTDLKFETFDQAQFMSEYAIAEQRAAIEELEKETYKGELAVFSPEASDDQKMETEKSSFRITKPEVEELTTNPIFVEYEKEGSALEEVSAKRKELEALVLVEEQKLRSLTEQRNALVKKAEGSKKSEKKKLMQEAEVLNQQIAEQQKRLDSTNLSLTKIKEQESAIHVNRARLLKTAGVEDAYKIAMLAEVRATGTEESVYIVATAVETKPESGATQATEITTGSVAAAMPVEEFRKMSVDIPSDLKGDMFVTATASTASPYSAAKPIPVDVKIPEGLIFKVQIGAYRNQIPQDLFKGFAPLMGEKMDNGITRYTAGLFRDFNNANRAKNEIRKMGYEDAFVVAFMNGVRVSFSELRNLGDADITLPPAIADASVNGVPVEVLNKSSVIDDAGEVSSAIAERTTNTAGTKGVFFAVQVGVFTNTTIPANLKVFRDLNSELLPNGNIRYSVGRFTTMEEAQRSREEIRATVADAFVTAYSDGVRITTSEAARILNSGSR